MSLFLPISQKEAWRLYNHSQAPIKRMKSWRDAGEVLPANLLFSEFKESYYFAISLSETESLPFLNLRKKFAWTIFGAASTFPMGMILTLLSFLPHIETLNTNYFYYRVIGCALLSITAYSISHMIKQAREETRLWHQLFDKYQVSDWKNTWR